MFPLTMNETYYSVCEFCILAVPKFSASTNLKKQHGKILLTKEIGILVPNIQ